jgi:hypothetical protein
MFIEATSMKIVLSPFMGERENVSLLAELKAPIPVTGSINISPLRGLRQLNLGPSVIEVH